MHIEINKQKNRISHLEKVIFKFNNMCTESLEYDLVRLEKRKSDLINELSKTDDEILEVQERIRLVKSEVEKMINPLAISNESNASNKVSGATTKKSHQVSEANKPSSNNKMSQLPNSALPVHMTMSLLDEQFLEESELFASIREAQNSSSLTNPLTNDSTVLFIIHLNSTSDIFVYKHIRQHFRATLNSNMAKNENEISEALVDVVKIPNLQQLSSFIDLPTYEKMMAYGAKIVPNHERDFPDIQEIPLPASLVHHLTPSNGNSNGASTGERKQTIGVLLGAFEIPLLPGVIIDVWEETLVESHHHSSQSGESSSVRLIPSTSKPRCWTTTPVDGIGFAVLERVYIKTSALDAVAATDPGNHPSDSNYGPIPGQPNTLVEASIFGRHPAKGNLLMECITSDT